MARQRFPAEFPARDNLQQVMRDERHAADTPQVWSQEAVTLSWSNPPRLLTPFWTTNGIPAGSAEPHGWMYQVVWKSPMFDLRPELRSALGQSKQTYAPPNPGGAGRLVKPSSTPLWNRDARLFVELRWLYGNPPTNLSLTDGFDSQQQGSPVSLRVEMGEWYSIHSLNLLPVSLGGLAAFPPPIGEVMSPVVDVTNQFCYNTIGAGYADGVGAPVAGLGVFAPPGTDAGGGGIGHPIRYWMVRLHFTYWDYANTITRPWHPNLPPDPRFNISLTAGVY